jgi:hypothetical protein
MKHFNPFDGPIQTHVDIMGGSLKLHNRGLLPLPQHDLSRVEKSRKPHEKK